MRKTDYVRIPRKDRAMRTSQIVFGERQHLLRVLDSLERTDMPATRMTSERRILEGLIQSRTEELNGINESWDQKVSTVLSAEAKPAELERIAEQAPPEDYYLLRLISEHPRVSSRTLGELAKHPYAAIKENVARHPNTDGVTLSRLSKDRSHPLWYLVAFNPNTPADLRQKLRDRMAKLGDAPRPK